MHNKKSEGKVSGTPIKGEKKGTIKTTVPIKKK